jgi:hypothetical protein
MTHSKLDIDSILEQLHRGGWEDGAKLAGGFPVMTVKQAKQALLEAFEQSLPPQKIHNYTVGLPGDKYVEEIGWNNYRNEAIKVIRGNDNELQNN